MRIDKYLWCTRYFKTRNLATEACKKKHVKINGVNVKPAKEVFGGEKIKVRKNQIDYELVVLDVPKNRVGAKLVDLYRKDITPEEAFDNQEFIKIPLQELAGQKVTKIMLKTPNKQRSKPLFL